ncbi:unnamed protein product [Prunus armeniaca]|uniref:Uncharacterized protein n=1 Tax=Prunus armeniaca TaxID=36596 RepID=A0A6J5WUZ2_PRUAR|nr:unnamed protein product [Prunus armeniaca]
MHQILLNVSQKAYCVFESSVGCLGLVGDQEGHTCKIHGMNLILVLAVLVLQRLVGIVGLMELHVLEIELARDWWEITRHIGHMRLQVLEIELRVGSLGMVGDDDEGQSCEFRSMNIAQWLLGFAGHVENKVLEME